MQVRNNMDAFYLKERLPKIQFISETEWSASSVFNPNEYPSSFKELVDSCRSRFSSVISYAINTKEEIKKQRERGFEANLFSINKVLPTQQDFFVEFSCPNILSNFEAFLISAKGLLDVLSRFLAHRINLKIFGFNRSGPKSAPNYGGKLLNALRNISQSILPFREEIIDLTLKHKTKWIDHLIAMRDNVVHDGDPKEFVNFWTIIKAGRERTYSNIDISAPELKDIGTVEEYCSEIIESVKEFTFGFRDIVFSPNERKTILEMQKKK